MPNSRIHKKLKQLLLDTRIKCSAVRQHLIGIKQSQQILFKDFLAFMGQITQVLSIQCKRNKEESDKQNENGNITRQLDVSQVKARGKNHYRARSSHTTLQITKQEMAKEINQLREIQKKERFIRMRNEQIHSNRLRIENTMTKLKPREKTVSGVYSKGSSIQAHIPVQNNASGLFENLLSKNFPIQNAISFDAEQSETTSLVVSQYKQKVLYCTNGHEFYRGELNADNLPHGKGSMHKCCSEGLMDTRKGFEDYQGQFMNGQFDGMGMLIYKGGITFIGNFKQGLREGEGRIQFQGAVEAGVWRGDRLQPS